jgi:hypothetical protein
MERVVKDDNSDEQIGRLVKTSWLALGISQGDLAETLSAAFKQTHEVDSSKMARIMVIANTLDLPATLVPDQPSAGRMDATGDDLQVLMGLCLLRAFCKLRDHRARRLIVGLTELIVRRQDNRGGAG